MLTANVDVAAAHTFEANPVMSSTGDSRWDTLNSGDTLTGDGVGSVLNLITNDNNEDKATKDILPTITDVETFNAQVYHGLSINSQFITGMKNVNLLELNGANFSMTGVNSKLENLNLSNIENNGTAAEDVTVNVNSDYLTATDDVFNVSLNKVVKGKVGPSKIDVASTNDVNVYETLNLASTGGTANEIYLKSNSPTLNIAGDTAITIGAQDAKNLKDIDASQLAASANILDVASKLNSATLTANDDKLSFNNNSFNKVAILDAGSGNDLLAINAQSVTAEDLNNASNFETLRLSNKTNSIDIGKLTNGIKNFEVAGNGDYTFTNVVAEDKFTVLENDKLGNADYNGGTASLTLTNKTAGSANTITFQNNSTNYIPANFGTLNTNSDDLTIAVAGTAGYNVRSIVAGSAADKIVNIKISGDQDFIVGHSAVGLANGTNLLGNNKGFNVDATALTGSLEIYGSDAGGSGDVQSDIIKGGAGNDIISTGTQFQGTSGVKGVAAQVGFLKQGTTSITTAANDVVSIDVANSDGTTDTYSFTIGSDPAITDDIINTATDYTALKALLEKTDATGKGLFVDATGATPKYLIDNYSLSIDRATGSLVFTQKAGTEQPLNTTNLIKITNDTTGGGAFTAVGTANMADDLSVYVTGVKGVAGIDGSYDVLTGGAGADKFVLDGFINGTNDKIVTTEITDFKSGEDKLVFLAVNAQSNADATNFVTGKVFASLDLMFDAAIAEFKATTDAAGNAKAGDTQYYVAQVGQDTYVINDGNIASGAGNAGSFYDVVKLTGVGLNGIAASDIVAA